MKSSLASIFFGPLNAAIDRMDAKGRHFEDLKTAGAPDMSPGNKLLKKANNGQLGYPTRGGRGVISRAFIAERKDKNQTLVARGEKPVHHSGGRNA